MDINRQVGNIDLVMTLSEVAMYLKVAEKTIHRMIGRNELPCAKVGGQWRFFRPMIDDWLVARMRGSETGMSIGDSPVPSTFPAKEMFVTLHVTAGSKEETLRSLISPFGPRLPSTENYLSLLLERERMLSTAVGNGVAFPHLRHPRANPRGGPYLVIGICPEGVDFDAPDETDVYLFALYAAHDETTHLRGMSRLAMILNNTDVVANLVAARSENDVKLVITQGESV